MIEKPELLMQMPLFAGIAQEEFAPLFTCVGARVRTVPRGDFLVMAGQKMEDIGIILSGRVQVIKEDYFGNRAVIQEVTQGGMFGESFVCAGEQEATVSVQAVQESRVLFLKFQKTMHLCQNACEFHNILVRNMVSMVAQKNVRLLEKLEILTKRTLREKMLAYLSQLALTQGSSSVHSPMGRVDLADFLGVDRSALTRELNRMRDEGMISFEKNQYTLLE